MVETNLRIQGAWSIKMGTKKGVAKGYDRNWCSDGFSYSVVEKSGLMKGAWSMEIGLEKGVVKKHDGKQRR